MDLHFYVADDFKVMLDGKLVAVGLFPDRVVVLQIGMEAPAPTAESPISVPLVFVACLAGAKDGEFEVSGRITAPSGKVVLDYPKHRTMLSSMASATMILKASPLVVPEPGLYQVVFSIGRQRLKSSFEVRVARVKGGSMPQSLSAEVPTDSLPATGPDVSPNDREVNAKASMKPSRPSLPRSKARRTAKA